MTTTLAEIRRYANFGNTVQDLRPVYYSINTNLVKTLALRGYEIPPEEIEFIASDTSGCFSLQDYEANNAERKNKMELFIQHYSSVTRMNLPFANKLSRSYTHYDGHVRHVVFLDSDQGKNANSSQVNVGLLILSNLSGSIPKVVNQKVTFVVPTGISTSDTGTINNSGLDYEILNHGSLLADVIDHIFSSRCKRLTAEEARIYYDTSKIRPGRLPIFTSDDAVVRRYGWKPGDLIMIERMNSSTQGSVTVSTYFRLVSNSVLKKKK